jgi:hypothetical protein
VNIRRNHFSGQRIQEKQEKGKIAEGEPMKCFVSGFCEQARKDQSFDLPHQPDYDRKEQEKDQQAHIEERIEPALVLPALNEETKRSAGCQDAKGLQAQVFFYVTHSVSKQVSIIVIVDSVDTEAAPVEK